METLLDEVSSEAYDKAVDKVAEETMRATRKDDIRLAEDSKRWIQSPERKASRKEKEYAINRLDGLIKKNRICDGKSCCEGCPSVKTAREEKSRCRRNQKRSEAVNQRKTCIERSKDSKRRGREKTTE